MTQHEFDNLAEKYLAGTCSPEEIALLEKWVDVHWNHQTDHPIFHHEAEAHEVRVKLWKQIRETTKIRKSNVYILPRHVWAGLAACLTLITFFYFYSNTSVLPIADKAIQGIEAKNIAQTRQKIVLPDGSIIILEKNSKIITDERYGEKTRTVYLTGEAFFEIKRNTKIPFLVYSGDLVTEVLGTSFRIKPELDGKTIEVSVKTGRVSVYANSPDNNTKKFNGVIITPNQKVLFDSEHKTIRPDLVNTPQLLDKQYTTSNFQFEEAKIETVLPIIQKAYGVDIVVANPQLNECSFTGDLNGLSIFKQLDFVCGVINASYEIRGTTIFITGQGCK